MRVVSTIKVKNSLIRFSAFQNITTLFYEVSIRSDVNGEYFLLNSLTDSSFMFLDNMSSLIIIATRAPIAAIITTIEQYADILVTVSPLYLIS